MYKRLLHCQASFENSLHPTCYTVNLVSVILRSLHTECIAVLPPPGIDEFDVAQTFIAGKCVFYVRGTHAAEQVLYTHRPTYQPTKGCFYDVQLMARRRPIE